MTISVGKSTGKKFLVQSIRRITNVGCTNKIEHSLAKEKNYWQTLCTATITGFQMYNINCTILDIIIIGI